MAVLLGMTRLLYAQSTIESLEIELDSVSQPMSYYLDKIEQGYPISIYYDNSKVNLSQPIRSEEKNITIKALFELGFENQSVDILFKERSILIQPKMRGSSSKKVTIKGFISDVANGEMPYDNYNIDIAWRQPTDWDSPQSRLFFSDEKFNGETHRFKIPVLFGRLFRGSSNYQKVFVDKKTTVELISISQEF